MDAAQENHVSHIHATGSSRSCSAFCASPSCIRIRLLTAAAPACHGNSFADIYWSRTQGLCTQLPIYQTHAQRPRPFPPRPQAALMASSRNTRVHTRLHQLQCVRSQPSLVEMASVNNVFF